MVWTPYYRVWVFGNYCLLLHCFSFLFFTWISPQVSFPVPLLCMGKRAPRMKSPVIFTSVCLDEEMAGDNARDVAPGAKDKIAGRKRSTTKENVQDHSFFFFFTHFPVLTLSSSTPLWKPSLLLELEQSLSWEIEDEFSTILEIMTCVNWRHCLAQQNCAVFLFLQTQWCKFVFVVIQTTNPYRFQG